MSTEAFSGKETSWFASPKKSLNGRLCEPNPMKEKAKLYGLAKSPKAPFFVIPAKAGIQSFQIVAEHLDSGFRRSDDFLRVH